MPSNVPNLYYLCFTGRARFPAQQLVLRTSLNPKAQSKSKQSRGGGCDGRIA